METLSHFYLTGYGCLEGITQKYRRLYACLCVMPLPQSNDATTDEVTLNCEIDSPDLIGLFQQLEVQRLAGHTLIVDFQVIYKHFKCCFHGMSPEHPDNMLMLEAKLCQLKGWYRDGQWFCLESMTTKPTSLDAA